MKLAIAENSGAGLQVRRLNTAYIADIKNGVKFWLYSLIFFGGFHFLTVGFNKVLQWANSAPIHVFPSEVQMLLLVGASAVVIAVNLLPDSDLLYSQNFTFDVEKNAFSVNGRYVTGLDKITVHLQDGFGPSRRALRIAVTAWGGATLSRKHHGSRQQRLRARSIRLLRQAKECRRSTGSTSGRTTPERKPGFLQNGRNIKKFLFCIARSCS